MPLCQDLRGSFVTSFLRDLEPRDFYVMYFLGAKNRPIKILKKL